MNYNYSKISKRFAAMIIDSIILIVINLLEVAILSNFEDLFGEDELYIILEVLITMTGIIYYSQFESSEKQATIGKSLMHIIVTDTQGNRLTFFKAVIRVLVKYSASVLAILFGDNSLSRLRTMECAVALFTPKKQALHDLIADSIVIDKETEIMKNR